MNDNFWVLIFIVLFSVYAGTGIVGKIYQRIMFNTKDDQLHQYYYRRSKWCLSVSLMAFLPTICLLIYFIVRATYFHTW